MTAHVSFRDLKRIPEISQYTELQMLSPKLDSLLKHYLVMFGVDCDYGLEYLPSIHRDLFNHVALGFRAVGETSLNRLDINGPFSDMTDRLVAAGYRDRSLLDELAELSGKSLDYRGSGEDVAEDSAFYPFEWIEEDYLDMENMIARLCDVRDRIRRSKVHNE